MKDGRAERGRERGGVRRGKGICRQGVRDD